MEGTLKRFYSAEGISPEVDGRLIEEKIVI